jgi:hypothetical protein
LQKGIIVWVVGEPGVGKTTLVREGLLEDDMELVGPPKWTVGQAVAAAGHYSGGKFDGADTVPYNGAAAALDYWATRLHTFPLTIFDGDRFSNDNAVKFFHAREVTHRLCCIHV